MRVKVTVPKYENDEERDIALQKAYNNLQRIFYYGKQERLREEKEKQKNKAEDKNAEKRE